MAKIIPALLPSSLQDFTTKLSQLQGITDEIQIDCVASAPPRTSSWPYTVDESFNSDFSLEDITQSLESVRFEADLMVSDMKTSIARWMQAGANRIVIHPGKDVDFAETIKNFQITYGHDRDFAPDLIALGVAVHIDSPLATIEPLIAECDFIQFMGIDHIGVQGAQFDKRVLQNMASFRRAYPNMTIQVDGGVSAETIPSLVSAGASRLVVGSALWNAKDLRAEFDSLTELAYYYSC